MTPFSRLSIHLSPTTLPRTPYDCHRMMSHGSLLRVENRTTGKFRPYLQFLDANSPQRGPTGGSYLTGDSHSPGSILATALFFILYSRAGSSIEYHTSANHQSRQRDQLGPPFSRTHHP